MVLMKYGWLIQLENGMSQLSWCVIKEMRDEDEMTIIRCTVE